MRIVRYWKPHSRIKLRFYKHYLQVCANHHKKDNYQKFTLADLYCGDPTISFIDGTTEDGSPLIALKKGLKCVFNDLDPNVYKKVEKLKQEYPEKILNVSNYDANEIIDEILTHIPSFYHSLFYIDPDNASQLRFETIQKIIDHTHIYNNNNTRRPELLLNFPVYSIVKNCGFIGRDNSRCQINNEFYGNDKWKDAFLSGNTPEERRENLFNAYLNNFRPFYEHSYSVLIESLTTNTALYYIIFFSNYDKIDAILPGLIKNITIWKHQDFIRKYKYNISFPIDYYAKEESQQIIERETKKSAHSKKQIDLMDFLLQKKN